MMLSGFLHSLIKLKLKFTELFRHNGQGNGTIRRHLYTFALEENDNDAYANDDLDPDNGKDTGTYYYRRWFGRYTIFTRVYHTSRWFCSYICTMDIIKRASIVVTVSTSSIWSCKSCIYQTIFYSSMSLYLFHYLDLNHHLHKHHYHFPPAQKYINVFVSFRYLGHYA